MAPEGQGGRSAQPCPGPAPGQSADQGLCPPLCSCAQPPASAKAQIPPAPGSEGWACVHGPAGGSPGVRAVGPTLLPGSRLSPAGPGAPGALGSPAPPHLRLDGEALATFHWAGSQPLSVPCRASRGTQPAPRWGGPGRGPTQRLGVGAAGRARPVQEALIPGADLPCVPTVLVRCSGCGAPPQRPPREARGETKPRSPAEVPAVEPSLAATAPPAPK